MLVPRRLFAALLAATLVCAVAPPGPGFASDTDLFRTNVPPNVLLVVDNSKSMNSTVWHADYGKSNPPGSPTNSSGDLEWAKQDECTYFRDIFDAAGISGKQRFEVYPGGRAVNMEDPTGFVVRSRATNNKSWEPRIELFSGTPAWNDADASGSQEAGEWDAYYKTCDPEDDEYEDFCEALPDYDGDGIGGRTVRDQLGNVITYTKGNGDVVPQLYKYDPDDDLGSGSGTGGKAVKVRETLKPRAVALAAGIDPETFTFSTSSLCGKNPNGWELWIGDVDSTTPNGRTIHMDAKYLDFLFSSYGDTARPAVFTPTTANDGIRDKAACVDLEPLELSTYFPFRRTRLMALRLILRTVTCELREDVRFGLAQFRYHGKSGDDNGGYVAVPIENLKDSGGSPNTYTLHAINDTHANHLARVIRAVGPDAQTPLNETLFQVYTYFMSRDSADLPPGRDWEGNPVTGVSFPVYDYNMDTHNPVPDDGGDLNIVGGHYVGGSVTTTHPKPASAGNYDGDGLNGSSTFPAWDSAAAVDPIEYACQKSFVLLITDGGSSGDKFDDQDVRINDDFEPPTDIETATDLGYSDFLTLIGDHVRNPDGSPDESETGSGSGTKYMDDIAKFMTTYDFRPDLDGDQTIDLYTVGYSVTSTGVSNVEKAAIAGNGLYFESSDADELAADIISALTDIIEKSQSFTSATVPASRTTDGDSFYSSYFLPKEHTPFWDGHLKAFQFTAAGDILTKDGFCAVGDDSLTPPNCPTSGQLLTNALAEWDAADNIPAPANRNLTTGKSSLDFGEGAWEWFDHDSAAMTQDRNTIGIKDAPDSELAKEPFLLPDPNSNSDLDALVPKLVSQVAGCQFGTVLGVDCANRVNEDNEDSMLGDIFHSNPVVVGSPNARINQPSYHAFAGTYRERDRVIYAGSNDGWLRGFNAGDWDTGASPPRHDRGTGVELMGFMPTEIRELIWQLPISQPGGTVREHVTVDGSPVAADVWIYRNVDGGGQFTSTLDPDASTKLEAQWRTVLLAPLRGGGRSISALDVTDPADAENFPRFLWDFPCQDCAAAINGDTDNEIASGGPSPEQLVGYSWSEPVITRVRVHVDSDPSRLHDRWVAVVGAGYDVCGDPNSLDFWQTASGAACDDGDQDKYSRGRAIFMIDITTGELLGVKAFHIADLFDGSGQVGYPEMEYAVASQPAVFDLDFDGYADVIYIGDLGGNLWKWVVKAPGHDPINNTGGSLFKSLGQPAWHFEHFFQADHSRVGLSPATPDSTTHFQSLFFPPTATLKGSTLYLAWGAGERAAPEAGDLDGGSPPPLGKANNNHFFVVKDSDPLHASGSAPTLGESDLTDIAEVDDGTYSCSDVAASKGFYLTARDTEKFITNSVIFLGEVITGSFVPAPPGADLCDASGDSFLYRFDLDCGAGAYQSNPGSEDDKRRKAIGGGMPTRPRVSVGGLNNGGSSGGCENKVVVITSDGGIDNDCPGNLPSSGIEIRSWRSR